MAPSEFVAIRIAKVRAGGYIAAHAAGSYRSGPYIDSGYQAGRRKCHGIAIAIPVFEKF